MSEGHRTPGGVRALGYEPVCVPGPGDSIGHPDHLGHDHVPGEWLPVEGRSLTAGHARTRRRRDV